MMEKIYNYLFGEWGLNACYKFIPDSVEETR